MKVLRGKVMIYSSPDILLIEIVQDPWGTVTNLVWLEKVKCTPAITKIISEDSNNLLWL
jgi:hypothetical protein